MLVRLVVRAGSAFNLYVYRLTRGRLMGKASGLPILLLTTTGAQTGRRRTKPLSYIEDGGRYVLIASYAGQARNPAWYHNLMANPDATIQIRSERIAVTASLVEGLDRARLWQAAAASQAGYEGYAARTNRTIPIVALVPTTP